jgi:hypothetical protein
MTLTVKKSDEFFIAIAKIRGNAHTFIFVGVKLLEEILILARVGKAMDVRKGNPPGLFSLIFSPVKAILKDEGVDRLAGWRQEITYEAYAISYQQYLQFMALLKKIQDDTNCFSGYAPIRVNQDEVELAWIKKILNSNDSNATSMPLVAELEDILIHNLEDLHLSNTCRHTAIDLINHVCGNKENTKAISTQFFCSLPLRTSLMAENQEFLRNRVGGGETFFVRPERAVPFYILPMPPTAVQNVSPYKNRVLSDLYKRMEEMLKVAPEKEETKKKFDLLKTFYQEQISQKSNSIDDFVNILLNWKNQHQKDISCLRATFFFDSFIHRRSATEKMFDRWLRELPKDYQLKPQG